MPDQAGEIAGSADPERVSADPERVSADPERVVEPVERQSLVDRVTSRLGEAILSGRYDRGATLPPERDLARALRVNRTSLKHALQRLEEIGFISTRHGVGSVVLDPIESAGARLLSHLVFRSSGIDEQVLADVIEARSLVGAFLSRLAAERRSEQDLMRMREIVAQITRATDDPDEVQRLELAFFRAILRATKNRIFVVLASSMFAIYQGRAQVFREAFRDRAAIRRSLERVLGAIAQREADGAEKAALDYLKKNGKGLLLAARDQGTRGEGER